MRDVASDLAEPGGPGDAGERSRGEEAGDCERQHHLPAAVLAVVAGDVLVEDPLDATDHNAH